MKRHFATGGSEGQRPRAQQYMGMMHQRRVHTSRYERARHTALSAFATEFGPLAIRNTSSCFRMRCAMAPASAPRFVVSFTMSSSCSATPSVVGPLFHNRRRRQQARNPKASVCTCMSQRHHPESSPRPVELVTAPSYLKDILRGGTQRALRCIWVKQK